MQIYYTTDEARTLEIARELGARLRAGDIVLLRGDMGAGKSVFARGLARGLGITSHITSPTSRLCSSTQGPLATSTTSTCTAWTTGAAV